MGIRPNSQPNFIQLPGDSVFLNGGIIAQLATDCKAERTESKICGQALCPGQSASNAPSGVFSYFSGRFHRLEQQKPGEWRE